MPDPSKLLNDSSSNINNEKNLFWLQEVRDKISSFTKFIALDTGNSFGEMALVNKTMVSKLISIKINIY